MYDDLVVVATYNGSALLPGLLESLGDRWPVLVIDTHSSDEEFAKYVKGLPLHDRTPYKGYATGAYLWAYWNHPAKNYLFLQDSMQAKEANYLEEFKSRMPEQGAVSWCHFGFGYDNTPQKLWADYYYGEGNDPAWGIFGPVFYTSHESLDIINNMGWMVVPPFNKPQAQGTERLWALAYHRSNLPVVSVAGEWNHGSMVDGSFPVFKKVWANRD